MKVWTGEVSGTCMQDTLETSLTSAQDEIQADVQDTKDDQASRNTINLALIVVVIALIILMLLLIMRTGKVLEEVRENKAPPEPVDEIVDMEMTEILLEQGEERP